MHSRELWAVSEHWRWPRRALRSRLLVAAASQRSGRQEGDRQRQTWLVELIELSASPPPSSVSQLPLCMPLSVAPPSLARQPDGMPIPAELQSLLSELNISPPTKEHAPVETVEALIAAVTDLDCSFSKNLLIKDKKAGQHGQSVRLWRRRTRPLRRLGAHLVDLSAACPPEGCESRATVRAARTGSVSTAAPEPPRAAAP